MLNLSNLPHFGVEYGKTEQELGERFNQRKEDRHTPQQGYAVNLYGKPQESCELGCTAIRQKFHRGPILSPS